MLPSCTGPKLQPRVKQKILQSYSLESTPDLFQYRRGFKRGAGDGIRTRDIDLGKVALYQLSYSRPKREFYCRIFWRGVVGKYARDTRGAKELGRLMVVVVPTFWECSPVMR